MGGAEIALIVAIFAILLMLVLLAIAETALNRISLVKARAISGSAQSRSARALVKLVERPERFINPLLVTVTVLQLGQAFLASMLADRLFTGWWGVAIVFVVNLVVFFVIAESMPKTWAVLHTERAGLLTAPLTQALVSFGPLRLMSRGLIGLTNVLIPGRGLKQGPFVSEKELLGIVGAAADDEVIEHEERELIESIIEFGDTVAREVMVPRPDMAIVDHGATVSEALDVAIAEGFSRLPVAGPDDQDVVGVAYTKDMIKAEREGRGHVPITELVREVRFVPENKPLRQLMREMQAGKFHLALVADEYGAISGLVTLEDCLEELVGEIVDEYDQESPEVERLPNGEYLVDGGTAVSELNDLLEIAIPDDDWDTIAGFVFNTLGQVPAPGDRIEYDGWLFIAEEIEGRRIRRLRVVVAPVHEEQDEARVDEPGAEGGK
jgi:CBS domain containing-hemolysin-like protein